MMQAEEDANDDIAAKSYQHTSAYRMISDEGQALAEAQALSGAAIHEALLKRAKAKELGLDSLAYNNSKLSQGMYREHSFNGADDDTRKTALGILGAKKKRESERKERFIQRNRKQAFNATGDIEEHMTPAKSDRQEFNAKRTLFQEPPGRNYNPYA